MKKEIQIPESITLRTIKNMVNGLSVIDALKKAIDDENSMIATMLDTTGGLSERGKIVSEHIMNRMYIKNNS